MSSIIHYNNCPVCGSETISPLLTVTDHSVTGESFVIWLCSSCTLRFTQDAPDAASIGRYYKSENYISHTKEARGLVNKVYLEARKITLRSKAKLVTDKTGLNRGTLLDVGAGTGAFLNYMQQREWIVTGLEPDADARRVAFETTGISLKEPDALQQLKTGSFDAVTLWHVLEHVHNLHANMDILKSLLQASGRLFIAVPNYTSLDADRYRSAWAAYDVPRHLYHFSPQAMRTLLQRHGLKLVAEKPMWLDAFYISLLSSKYKNGSTSWVGAAATGVLSNLKAALNREKCSSLVYIVRR